MFLDGHVHSFNLGHGDLEAMYLAGIRKFVSAVVFPRMTPVDSGTLRSLWDFQVEDEVARARDYLLDAYAMIGIAMVSVPSDPDRLLEVLPSYLRKTRVVAVGEIGLDPASPTCPDLGRQRELYVAQLEIASACQLPVVLHTPNKPDLKVRFTEEALRLARDKGFDLSRLVVDHCSRVNLPLALEAGAHAAITIQPWRGLTVEDAADLVAEFGDDRIWVNSDASDLPSDPLAVPRLAYALKKRGFSEESVRKVCLTNAACFYGLDP